MIRRFASSRYTKWGLFFVGSVFSILPASCEAKILRLVTPLLV